MILKLLIIVAFSKSKKSGHVLKFVEMIIFFYTKRKCVKIVNCHLKTFSEIINLQNIRLILFHIFETCNMYFNVTFAYSYSNHVSSYTYLAG